MVNPAFSESQLKNLRRQNRHLASTHRRKLVFLQASRNPAHGSGRPFFVRDVPVPASFCPAFALPAPVSAAPQLRPFCRPHRFCPRLPASPARRTKFGSVLCVLPFRIPTRHPGNGPVPASFCPAPVASAFAPPAPVSAAPSVLPSSPLLPSSSSLSRTPDRVRIRSMRAAVPLPCSAPRERSRPASFCPAPVASAFAPTAPGPCRSPAPAVPPSPPLLPSSSSLSRTPDRVRIRSVRAAVPHPRPAPRERSRPSIFLFGLRPSGSRFRSSPAPTVLPSSPLLPSSSSLSRTPDKVRVRTVHAAVPHHRPAPRERSRPTSFCPAFAPPAPASAAPPFSLFPAAAPPLPAATGRTGCSFGPAREKGCLTDLRQPRFYPYAIRELLPIRNFQRIGKTRQTAPFIRTAVRELLPPPPNMPLKGSKNLPDSSVRSRIAQPADRLPAPAAAGLSSSSHRSSGSPDR
ncbi:hypothetical protein BN3659_01155 [Alistipes sp. CHKCI003]|nr:hypothetical protein BN3659_01155 [Alistipes sp. CHKCI003]